MIWVFFLFSVLFPFQVWAADAVEVSVQLREFSVQAIPQTFKAGDVRLVAANKGSEGHELVVRKKEKGGFKDLGEIEPFAPTLMREITLNLTPGTYELSCQIVEKEENEIVDHYKKGMRTEIEVK